MSDSKSKKVNKKKEKKMFNFKKVTAVAAAFALSLSAVAFVGCGGNNASQGGGNTTNTQAEAGDIYDGTWTLAGMIVNGEDMSLQDYAAMVKEQSGQELTPDVFQVSYTFGSDGKGTLTMMGVETPFTYSSDGSNATVTVGGVDSLFTYDSAKGVIGVTDPNTGYTALYAK